MSWCRLVTLLVLVMLVTAGGGTQLGCRDQNGAIVDWYVLYKLPKIRGAAAPFVGDGAGYMYFSWRTGLQWWTMSDVSISDPLSLPGQTLKPVYDRLHRDSLIYAFYNDDTPNGTRTGVKGHTKGVVAFDGSSGFWMVHSVPRFPPPPGQFYGYPYNGKMFGQTFLCLTLSSSQLETVAQQLLYNEPFLYASQMSSSLKRQYPKMARVIAGERHSGAGSWSLSNLTTAGGERFLSFAKSRDFGKDLYSDLVAPELQANLYTETWMRAISPPSRLPSNCTSSPWVINVLEVSAMAFHPHIGNMTLNFGNRKDHSKWAVSMPNSNKRWVCVGDINRSTTQFTRGGGTVCHENHVLWTLFSRLVAWEEPCRETSSAHFTPALL